MFNTISIVSIKLLIHGLHVILKLTFYAILYQMNQTFSWIFFFSLVVCWNECQTKCVIGSFSVFEIFWQPNKCSTAFSTRIIWLYLKACVHAQNSGTLLSSTSIMHILYWSQKKNLSLKFFDRIQFSLKRGSQQHIFIKFFAYLFFPNLINDLAWISVEKKTTFSLDKKKHRSNEKHKQSRSKNMLTKNNYTSLLIF